MEVSKPLFTDPSLLILRTVEIKNLIKLTKQQSRQVRPEPGWVLWPNISHKVVFSSQHPATKSSQQEHSIQAPLSSAEHQLIASCKPKLLSPLIAHFQAYWTHPSSQTLRWVSAAHREKTLQLFQVYWPEGYYLLLSLFIHLLALFINLLASFMLRINGRCLLRPGAGLEFFGLETLDRYCLSLTWAV